MIGCWKFCQSPIYTKQKLIARCVVNLFCRGTINLVAETTDAAAASET